MDLNDLSSYDELLADKLMKSPSEYIPLVSWTFSFWHNFSSRLSLTVDEENYCVSYKDIWIVPSCYGISQRAVLALLLLFDSTLLIQDMPLLICLLQTSLGMPCSGHLINDVSSSRFLFIKIWCILHSTWFTFIFLVELKFWGRLALSNFRRIWSCGNFFIY